MSKPGLTAVSAAVGRASHVLLDDPPFVLEDSVSINLVDTETLRAAGLLTDDGRRRAAVIAIAPAPIAAANASVTASPTP